MQKIQCCLKTFKLASFYTSKTKSLSHGKPLQLSLSYFHSSNKHNLYDYEKGSSRIPNLLENDIPEFVTP